MLGNAGLFHLNAFSIAGFMSISPDSIAGLLAHNPFPRAINASLWTLPFEVSCYLAVAVLAASEVAPGQVSFWPYSQGCGVSIALVA
jgi:hypothetical protein